MSKSYRFFVISAKEEISQFIILTKHFFHRLFQNDVVDFEDQMKERIVGILVLLAVFSGLLSMAFLGKYSWIPDEGMSWREKCLILTFYMLVIGFIAILEWDIIFPDPRDYRNLSPLPVRIRTLLTAKFCSLCLFVGIFALGMNSISFFIFVLHLPQWQSLSPIFLVRFVLVHLLTMLLGCFFAFFINVFLIGLFLTLLGPRLFRRTSTFIRSFFLFTYLFMIFLYLRAITVGLEKIVPIEKLQPSSTFVKYFLEYFPPLWFTDVYETLLGNQNYPFHGSGSYALIGLVILIAGFCLTTGLSYRRYIKGLGASTQLQYRYFRPFFGILSNVFNLIFLRNSVQRAIFYFYKNTFRNSQLHKMRVATFLVIGLAVILVMIVPLFRTPANFLTVNNTLLSIPLILSSFLLLGLREALNIPVMLEANWIFRLTEIKKQRHYYSGLRKSIIFQNLVPLFVGLFFLYSILWDATTALNHCLFCFMVAVITMEVLFLTYRKIPFGCSYLPGKEKIQLYWLLYIVIFFAYINILVWIDNVLLRNPNSFIMFFGLCLVMVFSFRIFQFFFIYKQHGVKYEEIPEPVMIICEL